MTKKPGPEAVPGLAFCLRFDIAYDGTDFAGWAKQTDQRTVCGVLEEKLATVLGEPIALTVAGRTDSGVHAEGQVAHAHISAIPPDLPKLVRRLARFVPDDVRILRITHAPPDFDARFSAIRRHYAYRFSIANYGVRPLQQRFVVPARPTLDIAAMQQASQSLLGLHDFAAFCRYREKATTIRELQRFDWVRDGDALTAYVSADAFCWSMVRSLVGAALAVGEGRRPQSWLADLLTHMSRSSDYAAAPPRGLSLIGVDYPADHELSARNATTRDVRQSPTSCCGD